MITRISLSQVGKKYGREWIFRGFSYDFLQGNAYAITGHNGSGKSTLLQVLSGYVSPVEGVLKYHSDTTEVSVENIFRHITFASPYLEFPEELSLSELILFHSRFKPFYSEINVGDVAEICGLKNHLEKQVRYFSSGMKQRIRLGLAILSESSILLLDEPASNLDQQGVAWYVGLVEKYKKKRIIFVCSNRQQQEYGFCNTILSIEEYKNSGAKIVSI